MNRMLTGSSWLLVGSSGTTRGFIWEGGGVTPTSDYTDYREEIGNVIYRSFFHHD